MFIYTNKWTANVLRTQQHDRMTMFCLDSATTTVKTSVVTRNKSVSSFSLCPFVVFSPLDELGQGEQFLKKSGSDAHSTQTELGLTVQFGGGAATHWIGRTKYPLRHETKAILDKVRQPNITVTHCCLR